MHISSFNKVYEHDSCPVDLLVTFLATFVSEAIVHITFQYISYLMATSSINTMLEWILSSLFSHPRVAIRNKTMNHCVFNLGRVERFSITADMSSLFCGDDAEQQAVSTHVITNEL